MDIVFVLLGLIVGILIGMTGVGGGSVMTPLLIYGLGVSPIIAVGTDLMFAAITKLFGTAFHHKYGSVNWKIVGLLSSGSIPASLLALFFFNYLEEANSGFESMITTTLGIALIFTSFTLLFKNKLMKFNSSFQISGTPVVNSIKTIIVGFVLGALVTITSVGGGALGIVALYLIYPHLTGKNLVGTDIAHATLLTLIASIGHLSLGHINFHMLAYLMMGSLPGVYIGTRISTALSESTIRSGLACMLLVVGLRFVL